MRFHPFVFTGKERDEETGYSYFGARYMDHELMTLWLSVDPLADKYPGISPYNYCMWNPVKLVDPDGRDPIYGKIFGAVEKIGDDGKDGGKVYYVTGWTKQKVRMSTFLGRNYTGSLAPSENVFHVPTGNVAKDVQKTIDMVKQSGNIPDTQVEYGAHSMQGNDNAVIWDPGDPMRVDDNGAKIWSIAAFMKDGKPTDFYASDVEFVWHVQPTTSTPSRTDERAVFAWTYNGNMENATWFVVGAKDGKVSFLSGLGKCHTIDMKDFNKMSSRQ